jgi:hypothetical protein
MQLLEYEQAKIPDDEREACTRLSRSYLSAVPHFVSVPGSTSDKAHYVTLARRVFPGVRTLAYGQTATVRGEASDALCCLMYSVRCTRQEAPLPRSALDVLKERQDALLLGG